MKTSVLEVHAAQFAIRDHGKSHRFLPGDGLTHRGIADRSQVLSHREPSLAALHCDPQLAWSDEAADRVGAHTV